MQVSLRGGYAYIGHMGYSGAGTSILDVRDPRNSHLVNQLPAPHGNRSHKTQIVGDVLVVNNERNPFAEPAADIWLAGLRIFDLADPANPRPAGFLATPGVGVHRPTYWESPYVYFSGSDNGFTDQFFIVRDLSDPARPVETGRWWLPGMGPGETPDGDPALRYAFHHAIVRGDRAHCGWWDAGMVILDISNRALPRFVSRLDFGPDRSRATHTVLPMAGGNLLYVTDEAIRTDPTWMRKQVWIVDVADETAPSVVGTFPRPEGEGSHFGPHNLHEMRPGTFDDPATIFLTYGTGGLRVYDARDPLHPIEKAYFVPDPPPGRSAPHTNDVLVDKNGIVYMTDRFTGGLYVLELMA
jgi:hypothetical protein